MDTDRKSSEANGSIKIMQYDSAENVHEDNQSHVFNIPPGKIKNDMQN